MTFRRFHYAWVVTAVTFVALLAAASVRAAPGVIIIPLESEFGWDRASISLAVSISLITFGLGGPVGGTLVDRFGPRRALLSGLAAIAVGLFLLLSLHDLWQLYLVWGILIGVGTGVASQVTGATVAHRWFRTHRGVVVGLFGAATSAGQLIFVPTMMALTVSDGWRSGIALLMFASLVVIVPVLFLMRDRPSDVGVRAFGEGATISAEEKAADARRTPLGAAIRTKDFWLLAGSFFVCGYTSSGLVGTHLIPHAIEHGFTTVTSATAVGLMGAMNIVGTLASGWFFFSHMCGAALAAYAGGYFHTVLGDYHLMFISAGILGFVAVSLALRISPARDLMPHGPAEVAQPAAI